MANICRFEMHAKGRAEDLAELFCDMADENLDKTFRERHMAGIRTVHCDKQTPCEDNLELLEISGTCSWSAYMCMTREYMATFGQNLYHGLPKWFIGIEEETTERNLEIEVHDSEAGFGFATRIVARPHEPLAIDNFDYSEILYDADEGDDLEDIKSRFNLTDAEVETLTQEGRVIRTDFDGTWYII